MLKSLKVIVCLLVVFISSLFQSQLQTSSSSPSSEINSQCLINGKQSTRTEVSKMASYFHVIGAGQSSCPSSDWLLDFARTSSTTLKIFINVGFNKGYNFAIWANVWWVILWLIIVVVVDLAVVACVFVIIIIIIITVGKGRIQKLKLLRCFGTRLLLLLLL